MINTRYDTVAELLNNSGKHKFSMSKYRIFTPMRGQYVYPYYTLLKVPYDVREVVNNSGKHKYSMDKYRLFKPMIGAYTYPPVTYPYLSVLIF
jgi:hypothetical protein